LKEHGEYLQDTIMPEWILPSSVISSRESISREITILKFLQLISIEAGSG